MTKRARYLPDFFAFCLLFLVAGACFFVPDASAAARSKKATPAMRSSSGEVQPTVLVLPFQISGSQQLDALGDEFPSMLGKRLQEKGMRVIPDQTMRKLLTAGNVATIDLNTARKLAQDAGATHTVYGTIAQIGDSVSIDARFVPVSASQDTKVIVVEQEGGPTNLQAATQDLSSRISGQFLRTEALAGVEVRGTKVLDPEVVLMRISTRKGDMLDSSTTDKEVKRIWDLGYFSDVRVEVEHRPEGSVLVYTVVEKPRVESIATEGASAISEEDILAAMGSKAGSILNEKLLAEDIQKILELYRKDGFYLATVEPRTETRQGGAAAAITLSIKEGKKLYISKVSIEGTKELDESDVKGEMLLSERSMISWITGTGVLKEELIERDSAAISSYYLDRGFMDITVGAAKIDYTEEGIEITFPISEGQRYKLGDVKLAGDLIDTQEKLEQLIKLDDLAKDNDYFKLSAMQDDARKLGDRYADFGYAYAEVTPRTMKRPEGEPIVDVTYIIDKKHKVYVRRVMVEGNNKTRDNVILREMRLTDNEPFDGSKLRRSTERLNKLGFFEMAEAELVPTANEDEVDLKIKVKERPTGALMGGVGYSTFSSVGVTGTLMERNLWGKGYNVALQAAFSGRRDAYTFSFTNPRLNDTNLSIGTDLYHLRDDYIDYRKRTTGGILRFGYPIGEYTTLGWGYRLDAYELYDLEDDASKLIEKYATGQRFSSVGLGRIVRDTTNRERPTSGNIDSISVEYGGGVLAGDDDFISLTAEHQTYYELAQDHVLHVRAKGAALFNNGSDEVPVFERFWMGGIDSVRGYDSRNLVPRDPLTNDRIGGTRMAFANLEYIWSVNNEIGVNLVPFFDIGFNIDKDNPYKWSDEIKRSYGMELRWRSPMGDLRFSYGIPLDEDRRGKTTSGRFEFSMGKFF